MQTKARMPGTRADRSTHLKIFELWCLTDLTLKQIGLRFGYANGAAVSVIIRKFVDLDGPLRRTEHYLGAKDEVPSVGNVLPFNKGPHTPFKRSGS